MIDREYDEYCDRDITPCYPRDIAGAEEPTVEHQITKNFDQIQEEMQKNYLHNAVHSSNSKEIYYKPYNQIALRQTVKKALLSQNETETNTKFLLVLSFASLLVIIGIMFITAQFQ